MIATACQSDPTLFDVDRRMTRVDIDYAVAACHTCPVLAACRQYLADCDTAGVKVHGIIAGQIRPWPDSKHPKLVRCRSCGRLCVSEWRRSHYPDTYGGYPRLASADCCTMCWLSVKAGAA
jgi:hypothetical protein